MPSKAATDGANAGTDQSGVQPEPQREDKRPRHRRDRRRRVAAPDPDTTIYGDPKAVRAHPHPPAPLRRVAWILLAGAMFGFAEIFLLGGLQGYVILFMKNRIVNPLLVTYCAFTLTVAVVLVVGSFHFHPRRSYGFALLTSLGSMTYGLLNLFPCFCCGLNSVASAASPELSGEPIDVFFIVLFVFAVLPATILPLLGGGLGLKELLKSEVKRLYLD
jgi:hypothetical protein